MSERTSTGRFAPGHKGFKKGGTKHRITTNMLLEWEQLSLKDDYVTPVRFWTDILNNKVSLDDMNSKESMTIKLKAAELLAKYIYETTLGTEELESKLEITSQQIDALKSAFTVFDKG